MLECLPCPKLPPNKPTSEINNDRCLDAFVLEYLGVRLTRVWGSMCTGGDFPNKPRPNWACYTGVSMGTGLTTLPDFRC